MAVKSCIDYPTTEIIILEIYGYSFKRYSVSVAHPNHDTKDTPMFAPMHLRQAALALALLAPADAARGQGSDAVAAITGTLRQYEAALNAGDTDAVMRLYAEDGVFMPQHLRSAVGAGPVRAAYEGVFGAIRLNVVFDIVEVVPVADDWAFARTNSAGTVTVLATGRSGPEANQELFVMRRLDGTWKIARYAFSTTSPARP